MRLPHKDDSASSLISVPISGDETHLLESLNRSSDLLIVPVIRDQQFDPMLLHFFKISYFSDDRVCTFSRPELACRFYIAMLESKFRRTKLCDERGVQSSYRRA